SDPQFFRQAKRHAQLHRADIVLVAAERVLRGDIARTDTRRLKPAQIVAVDEETVLQQHLLAAPTENVTGLARYAQHPARREGLVKSGADFVPKVLHAKAETREIVAQRHIPAARRVDTIVAAVIKQHLAD